MKTLLLAITFSLLAFGLVGPQAARAAGQGAASAAAPTQEQQLKIAQAFADAFLGGHYTAADAMLSATTTAALRQGGMASIGDVMKQLEGALGKVLKAEPAYADSASQGTLVARVACAFQAQLLDLEIAVDSAGHISGTHVVPHVDPNAADAAYVDPAAYSEVTVSFGDSNKPTKGTLTVPTRRSEFPVVVMLSGSGPNDQDESIGPNKPFRDLARGLATAGIATLRFDKRTKTYGLAALKAGESLISYEYVDDAKAALALAASVPGAAKLVLLGHSEGAIVAPAIIKGSGQGLHVAGVACLAGPVTPVPELALYQYGYLAQLTPSAAATQQVAELTSEVQAMRSGSLAATANVMGVPVSYWQEIERMGDPATVAGALGVPVLATFGERDYQVPAAEAGLWRAKLDGAANAAKVTIRVYPGMNHLLMLGEGVPSPAEYGVQSHVDVRILADLVAWVWAL